MKKILLTLILMAISLTYVSAEDNMYFPDISMTISTNRIVTPNEVIEVDEVAVIRNDRAYFPLRGIAEYYGVDIKFIEETKTIVLKDSYLEAYIQPYEEEMIISYGNKIPDRIVKLEAPAYLSDNGRTMLPMRAVAEEVFGCDVEWVEDEKKVVLSKNYQTKRLIAKAADSDYQFNIPDVTISESGLENVYFIDFPKDTPDGIVRYHYSRLSEDNNIIYVEPDVVLYVQLS